MPQPSSGEYAAFYQPYIDRTISYLSVQEALQAGNVRANTLLTGTTEVQSLYAYAPGKWTIKEVVQHLIDCERIFGYRALSIARAETAGLPGFDENAYAAVSGANYRRWEHLLEEFFCLRQSTLQRYRSFNNIQLQQTGTANQHTTTPNAIGFIIAGHQLHHLAIIQERYLLLQPQKLYA